MQSSFVNSVGPVACFARLQVSLLARRQFRTSTHKQEWIVVNFPRCDIRRCIGPLARSPTRSLTHLLACSLNSPLNPLSTILHKHTQTRINRCHAFVMSNYPKFRFAYSPANSLAYSLANSLANSLVYNSAQAHTNKNKSLSRFRDVKLQKFRFAYLLANSPTYSLAYLLANSLAYSLAR